MWSAWYSRERLIAICTSMAASGARMIAAIVPIQPTWLFSRLPPNSAPNCRYCASMETAPPMVAATAMVSVS